MKINKLTGNINLYSIMAAKSSVFMFLCSVLLSINLDYVKESKGGHLNVHVCPLEGGRASKMVKILSTWLLNVPLSY